MMCAKFARQRSLVVSSIDRNCLEAHLPCILHSEMAQSADAMHSDEFSGARARIPQRVEDRYACAHKRARLRRRQFIGNHCQRGNWCDHVLGIPTVEVDAGDFSIDAHREVTTSALFAHKTMSTMPTYP